MSHLLLPCCNIRLRSALHRAARRTFSLLVVGGAVKVRVRRPSSVAQPFTCSEPIPLLVTSTSRMPLDVCVKLPRTTTEPEPMGRVCRDRVRSRREREREGLSLDCW